jgi:hypothetical protein
MSVTGDQVLEAFTADPRVSGPEDPQLVMMEPFIKALPEILADSLDKPVTLEVLFDAKLRFMQYCLDNGIGERIRTTMKDVLADEELADTADMMTGVLGDLIEQMKEMAPQLNEMLADQGVTEEQVFASSQVGLNENMLSLHKAGTLTLDTLLANQPGVVIVNES